MKYIYTAENCPKCEILKKNTGVKVCDLLKETQIMQQEDEIDREALVASMQNMELSWKLICSRRGQR